MLGELGLFGNITKILEAKVTGLYEKWARRHMKGSVYYRREYRI